MKRSRWASDDEDEDSHGDEESMLELQSDSKRRRLTTEEEYVDVLIDQLRTRFVRSNGQLDITRVELSKLKHEHGVPRLAKALCSLIAVGSGSRTTYTTGKGYPLPYPHKRHFMGDVTYKFRALQRFPWQQRQLSQPYHRIDGFQHRTRMFAVPFFDDGYLRVESRPSDYDDIDVVTDYFNEEPRLRSRRLGSAHNAFDHWTNAALSGKWMDKLLRMQGPKHVKKYDYISPESLRETLAYADGIRECTQFKPTLALSIIRILKGTRVLDFSSGWGDRLMAAIAANVDRYVGVDPNADLQPGYSAIIAQFADHPERFTMVQAPFQTAVLPVGETYDLVFTSPPYFNFELYSNPNDQSAVEGTGLVDWLMDFLFEALDKSWGRLDDGGNMAIHIVDINHQVGAFTEIMNLYIQGFLPEAQYRGVICSCGGESGRARPVWVWRKGLQGSEPLDDKVTEARLAIQDEYPQVAEALRYRAGGAADAE
mmetsp:Transcript_136285/g.236426  ORF Transcript_136285/g.236426 Transcript_136285/m.236426 type:complete len:482 (-) Transcript_136285:146-1591(-)